MTTLEIFFAVVAFVNEQDALFIIPVSWLINENTACYWPPYITDLKISKAAKNLEIPKDTWGKHNLRVLYYSDTYAKALLKLKTAEMTSDLETDLENKLPRSKLKRKAFYDNEESDLDQITDSLNENTKSLKVKKNLPEAPKIREMSSVLSQNMASSSNFIDQSIFSMSESTASSMLKTGQSAIEGEFEHQFEYCSTPIQTTEEQLTVTNLKNESFNKTIITYLAELKSSMKYVQRQTELNTQLIQTMLDVKGDDSIFEVCGLPVNDVNELEHLENLLKNDKTILTKLVIAVASKGGQTIREAVKRMLYTLFTNNLCCKMNWTGFRKMDGATKKISFKELTCQRVIEKAIRRNSATRNCTESDIQREVVRFLHGATDREGGRKARQHKNVKENLNPSDSDA